MKFYMAVLLCCISYTAFSQISNYVTMGSKGGPSTSFIYYSAKPLVWENFKATPPPPSDVGAITRSGFGYRSKLSGTSTNGRIDIEVFSFMDPAGSWVRPNKKNDYVLNHEQRHFDITHIVARDFARKAQALKFSPTNTDKLLSDLYNTSNELLRQMQKAYDGETDHGRKPAIQILWNDKINKLLEE